MRQSASLGNMHGFDADSRLVRVDSPHEVIRMLGLGFKGLGWG